MSIILVPITGGVRCGYSSTGTTKKIKKIKAIFSSSLSFEGGIGGKGRRGGGCQIQSVINEHFKRPNCGC